MRPLSKNDNSVDQTTIVALQSVISAETFIQVNVAGITLGKQTPSSSTDKRSAKKRKVFRIPIIAQAEIVHVSDAPAKSLTTATNPNYAKAARLPCELQQAILEPSDDGHRILQVTLSRPFRFCVADLLVLLENSEDSKGWTRTLAKQYNVNISILFHTKADLAETCTSAQLWTSDEDSVLVAELVVDLESCMEQRSSMIRQVTASKSLPTHLCLECSISLIWSSSTDIAKRLAAQGAFGIICPYCLSDDFSDIDVLFAHLQLQHPWLGGIPMQVRQHLQVLDIVQHDLTKTPEPKSLDEEQVDSGVASTPEASVDSSGEILTTILDTWGIQPDRLNLLFKTRQLKDASFLRQLARLSRLSGFDEARALIEQSQKERDPTLSEHRLKDCTEYNLRCAIKLIKKSRKRSKPVSRAQSLVRSDSEYCEEQAESSSVVVARKSAALPNRLKERGSNKSSSRSIKTGDVDGSGHPAVSDDETVQPTLHTSAPLAPPVPSPARITTLTSPIADAPDLSIPQLTTAAQDPNDAIEDVDQNEQALGDEDPLPPNETEESNHLDINTVVEDHEVTTKARQPRISHVHAPSEQRVEQPIISEDIWRTRGLPAPSREPYPVPVLSDPTLALFKETLLRRLKPEEQVVEYDDEIDETWQRMKQDQKIDAYQDMTFVQKSLMKRWNHQMLDEKLNGHKHLPDATIRFVTANRSWLAEKEHLSELIRLLGALRYDKLLSDETIATCIDIIRKPAEAPARATLTTRKRAKAKAAAGKNGSRASLLQAVQDAPQASYVIHDQSSWTTACLCGKPVDDGGQLVICSNPECDNPEYHLRCVGIAGRIRGWRCERCAKHSGLNDKGKGVIRDNE